MTTAETAVREKLERNGARPHLPTFTEGETYNLKAAVENLRAYDIAKALCVSQEAEIQKLREADRWISVLESLPDFGVPVLVSGGVAELRHDGWWTLMECPARPIQWIVTHWRPLPPPPAALTPSPSPVEQMLAKLRTENNGFISPEEASKK